MINNELNSLVGQVNAMDIRIELFRKGDFSFIVEGLDEDGNWVSHEKQRKALEYLTSGRYDEFLYGGAAGGAKTWTGCVWLLFMSLCYPGIKSFIGRNELKDIIESVYVTFGKVCKAYGFKDYTFNAAKNFIQFGNKSHINFIEVKYKPSDPMYEDVGSTEYTIGWGEEISEWHENAATVLSTRVGRHLNKKNIDGKYWTKENEKGEKERVEIRGSILWTCNPKNNWGKSEFHDKDKNGTLEPNKAYLQCLITENPFIEKAYVEKQRNLAKKNKGLYERLFKGNWDYQDNPHQLAEQESIEAIFNNEHVPEGKTYVTADIARHGSDKAVIIAWSGWRIKEIISYDYSSIPTIVNSIKFLKNKYRVSNTRTIVDADGIGASVLDYVGSKGFKNNGRVIGKGKNVPNYRNLQVQCLYLLAEQINQGQLHIDADITEKEKTSIREELAQIESAPSTRDDTKLDCKKKGDIKSDIGRSPDYRDAIFMRVFFDLKKSTAELSTKWN